MRHPPRRISNERMSGVAWMKDGHSTTSPRKTYDGTVSVTVIQRQRNSRANTLQHRRIIAIIILTETVCIQISDAHAIVYEFCCCFFFAQMRRNWRSAERKRKMLNDAQANASKTSKYSNMIPSRCQCAISDVQSWLSTCTSTSSTSQ